MLSINQVLQEGRYRIVGHSGQEDTGLTTYQAFDNVLKTNVIIKETVFDTAAQSSFSKQIEGLTLIKHESFMQIHDCFSEVNRQFLVTESVEGENLKSVLEKKKRPFLLFDVLSWTEQLLDAMIYLHSRTPQIIHRDIAPHNLMLTKDNKIKLLASAFDAPENNAEKKALSNVRLPYSSLELLWDTLDPASQKVILNSYDENSAEILESPIDSRSDIYALGATIYYLVTGVVPVDALERSIDLLEGKEDRLANPSKINPQIPRKFSHFLMKALELKRENRFATAAAMRSELQPMLELMKKVERETQKNLEDPKVREAALREVELARENLRKQRETENLHQSQEPPAVEPKVSAPSPTIEPAKISQTPISQGAFLEEIEKAKQNLQQRNEIQQLPNIEVEPAKIESPPELPQTSEAEKAEPIKVQESVLVATAPAEPFELEQTIDDTEGMELFETAQPRKGKSWLIPAICVLAILFVGGFFGFKFLNSSKPTNTNQEAGKQNAVLPAESPKTETPAPAKSETPAPDNNLNSQTPPPAPTVETQTPQPTPVVPADDKSKIKKVPTPTPTPPPVDKKPTPAAKSPTPKKKELTVDDLIN
jgi:serine/threonine-protein kinase